MFSSSTKTTQTTSNSLMLHLYKSLRSICKMHIKLASMLSHLFQSSKLFTPLYYMSVKLPFFHIKEEVLDPIILDSIYTGEVQGKSDL